MHIARMMPVVMAMAGVAAGMGAAHAATPNVKAPNMALTPAPSSTLHCRKGQCSAHDIKVVVDDRKQPCTLKVEFETITVHGGNRGINNAGVKLRWMIDDASAKNRWFFYPSGVTLANNNGDFADNGTDEAKKSYGLTDLNAKDDEFSTPYTIVVMDKDRKARCTGEGTIVNKRGGGRGSKARNRQ